MGSLLSFHKCPTCVTKTPIIHPEPRAHYRQGECLGVESRPDSGTQLLATVSPQISHYQLYCLTCDPLKPAPCTGTILPTCQGRTFVKRPMLEYLHTEYGIPSLLQPGQSPPLPASLVSAFSLPVSLSALTWRTRGRASSTLNALLSASPLGCC